MQPSFIFLASILGVHFEKNAIFARSSLLPVPPSDSLSSCLAVHVLGLFLPPGPPCLFLVFLCNKD